jgi:hypothetical protein
VLLAAVLGAEGLALVASAGRYWPFGANRTNLFLVPLLVVVAAVGADRLARVLARSRQRPRATAAAETETAETQTARTAETAETQTAGTAGTEASTAVHPPPAQAGWRAVARRVGQPLGLVGLSAQLVVLAATPAAAASALWPLWRERAQVRPVELLGDATVLTRRLYGPSDLLVVGGRLARPGWLYSMELSADRPYLPAPAGLPTAPGPRVSRAATVFLPQIGPGGTVRALRAYTARNGPPARILLFVLVYDRRGTASELAGLRRAGWCQTASFEFPSTGALYSLRQCPTRTPTATPHPHPGQTATTPRPAPAESRA